VIRNVRAFPGRAEFDLEVRSHLRDKVRISQFSLATAIRTVKLSHSKDFIWKIERPKIIEDPPPTDEDFTFSIEPGATNRITVATPPLTRDSTTPPDPSAPGVKPKEVHYKVAREVGTIATPSGQFNWVLCSGAGKSRIDWRNQPQP